MRHSPTRTITLAVLTTLIMTSASTAQQPHGLARQALDDSTLDWIGRSAPNLRVFFLRGSYAAEHQDSLVQRVVSAREQDLQLLGETRFDSTQYVFFLQDRPQMLRITGMRATGLAERATGAIFLVTNPDWRAFERHEMMHVLAYQLWGVPAEPSAWLQEGFAQFADGACGGYPIDPVVTGLAGDGGFFSIDTLMARFRQLNDLSAYLQAASFVGYLYRAYGRDVVRATWQRGLESSAAALNHTPADLQRAWIQSLPRPSGVPSADELAVIRKKGCG